MIENFVVIRRNLSIQIVSRCYGQFRKGFNKRA